MLNEICSDPGGFEFIQNLFEEFHNSTITVIMCHKNQNLQRINLRNILEAGNSLANTSLMAAVLRNKHIEAHLQPMEGNSALVGLVNLIKSSALSFFCNRDKCF